MPSAAASRATRLPILPSPITPEHRSAHAPRRAGRALLPDARLHRAVEADDAAQPGQRAGQREVGDLAAAVVGRAVAGHAGGAQVVEVEVVVARRARDHGARVGVAGEQAGIDRRCRRRRRRTRTSATSHCSAGRALRRRRRAARPGARSRSTPARPPGSCARANQIGVSLGAVPSLPPLHVHEALRDPLARHGRVQARQQLRVPHLPRGDARRVVPRGARQRPAAQRLRARALRHRLPLAADPGRRRGRRRGSLHARRDVERDDGRARHLRARRPPGGRGRVGGRAHRPRRPASRGR